VSADDGGPGRREVAYRLFAAEYDDADFSYSESDEERAPNYVVTPSGARVNRLFVVGVLTELERVNEDVLRARIVDPTGAFVVYAGQYQPDALAFLERAEPPTFVALTGKARTFKPDDADTVYTSVRPESINEVDAETRDRWVVQTAEQTLHRVATMADALGRAERGDDLAAALAADGVDESLASGTALALEHYGTTPTYLDALREAALDAARVVAGDREEVEGLSVAPDAEGSTTLAALTALDSPAGETGGAAEADTELATSASEATGDTATADSSPAPTESDDTPPTGQTDAEPGTEQADTEPAERESTETTVLSSETADQTSEPETIETVTETTTTDAGGSGPDAETDEADAGDDIGDFEGGEFELEDDERERIEEEYGTDFSTGTEVEEPGEADIETPDPEDLDEEAAGTPTAESTAATDSAAADPEPEPADTETVDAEPGNQVTGEGAEPEPDESTESEPPESPEETATDPEAGADEGTADVTDVDLTDAAMDAMRELDEGDGADHDDVVASVVEEHGADPEAVEEAIQDALMDGRCYEPADARLKPI